MNYKAFSREEERGIKRIRSSKRKKNAYSKAVVQRCSVKKMFLKVSQNV